MKIVVDLGALDMINNWIIFRKKDGKIGVLPDFLKPKGEVIESFFGSEEDAIKRAAEVEKGG